MTAAPSGTLESRLKRATPENGARVDQVQALRAEAMTAGAQPFIQLTAEWCPVCQVIDASIEEPELASPVASTWHGRTRVDEDALRQGCVLPEAEPASEPRMADEPEREIVAAVEVEAAQTIEFVEEVVAEALGLIEDDDRDDVVLVERDERAGRSEPSWVRRGPAMWRRA